MIAKSQQTAFELVNRVASDQGVKLFVVGGVVRDLLLGHAKIDEDIDFMVDGNAIEFGANLAQAVGGTLKVFSSFLTAKIIRPALVADVREIDLASARTEIYARGGELPQVSLASWKEDLRRRDFSINALAIAVSDLIALGEGMTVDRLREKVIDLFGGVGDLNQRQIRVLHDRSFRDDPTRMFRAVRYQCRLGGKIEPHTLELLHAAVKGGTLQTISLQRSVAELRKMSAESQFVECLSQLKGLGVLASLPEICGRDDDAAELAGGCRDAFAAANADERFKCFIALTIDSDGIEPWRRRWIDLGVGRRFVDDLQRQLLQVVSEDSSESCGPLHKVGVVLRAVKPAIFERAQSKSCRP